MTVSECFSNAVLYVNGSGPWFDYSLIRNTIGVVFIELGPDTNFEWSCYVGVDKDCYEETVLALKSIKNIDGVHRMPSERPLR